MAVGLSTVVRPEFGAIASGAKQSGLRMRLVFFFVIPAKAGIQKGPSGPLKSYYYSGGSRFWIPTFAGMTEKENSLE